MGCLEQLKNLGAGMPIVVVQPTRNDGESRRNPRQEAWLRGGGAAVMSNFEQSAFERVFGEHSLFDGRFSVPFEQNGRSAIGDAQHK